MIPQSLFLWAFLPVNVCTSLLQINVAFTHPLLGDPLLRQLETTVVGATLSQPVAPIAGKKSKKAVLAPTLPDDPILEVILHDTVIFPEGGGQPTDQGMPEFKPLNRT